MISNKKYPTTSHIATDPAIKNNSPKNIREIKRLLCRCLNSKKVQGFELSQWSEIVNLPSVCPKSLQPSAPAADLPPPRG